jgi:hypothetical protein
MQPPAPIPVLTVSPDQPVPDEFDLLCEGCGYSLIGLMVDRCPECGGAFDATALPLARVPWLYRKRLGRLSAYAKTLRFALLSPGKFAAELCRPVRISAADAHRFRILTIRVAALGVVLGLAGYCQYVVNFWPPRPTSAWMVGACLAAWLVTFVFLRMATDLPTFIWRGMPGRTYDLSPLHQYAAAPLALFLPAAIVFVALTFGLGAGMITSGELTEAGALVLVALIAIVLAWSWAAPLIFMQVATRCSVGRVALLALYLPVHWVLMAALVLMASGAIAYHGGEALW